MAILKQSNVSGIATVLVCLFATASAFAQSNDESKNTPVILVELFTSEGCSSCPPADANLKRLKELAETKGYPIHTLSFHVDYWDKLGWKDPFSSVDATRRQQQYSQAFGLNRIYTPQFVVNGTWEFVGSNRAHTRVAIQQAFETQTTAELTLTARQSDDSGVKVTVGSSAVNDGDQFVVALIQKEAETDVLRGENADRHLKHVHVVRTFQQVDAESEKVLTLEVPEGFEIGDHHVIAYQQSKSQQGLAGLAKAEIGEPEAK